jgi:hypothetical protein
MANLVGLEYENRYINAKMRLGRMAWSCMGSVPFQLDRPLEDRGLLDELGGQKGGVEIVRAIFGVSQTCLQENILHVKINGLEYHMLVKKRGQ